MSVYSNSVTWTLFMRVPTVYISYTAVVYICSLWLRSVVTLIMSKRSLFLNMFSTACLSECWVAREERINSIIDFTNPSMVRLHNKNIHFAVMNCWSVLGLRWRDLCIIVLCQDIAAIDSSDTPGYHLYYSITGTEREGHTANITLTETDWDWLTCSSLRPLPGPGRSRRGPHRRWWRWPPRNSGSTSFSLISGLQHQTSWNKMNISA